MGQELQPSPQGPTAPGTAKVRPCPPRGGGDPRGPNCDVQASYSIADTSAMDTAQVPSQEKTRRTSCLLKKKCPSAPKCHLGKAERKR